MTAHPIARVSNLTPEHFAARFVHSQTPVVLTGTGLTNPLLDALRQANVVRVTQGRSFQFKRSYSGAHPNFRVSSVAEMFAREPLTFAQFFQQLGHAEPEARARYIFTGDEHYLWRVREGVKSANPDFGDLVEAVQVPRYVPHERVYSVWTWFSGKGVRTWLHYDNNACHNLNLQVHGTKHCTLFPPHTVGELEFFEPGGVVPAFNCSSVDVDSVAGKASIAQLPHYEVTLQQGDVLFIPAHWIHTFSHHGNYNANVNFWWRPNDVEEPLVHQNAVAEREARLAQRHKQA